MNKFTEQVGEQQRRVLELLLEKRQDYGERNIQDFGILGVIVRMSDKMTRMKHAVRSAGNVDDILKRELEDVAGYAILGLIELENNPNAS